jgi:hypothetical protein
LNALADAVESGGLPGRPGVGESGLDLPGYPRTVAAVELLESGLNARSHAFVRSKALES